MLDTLILGNELKRMGFNFYCGVPCSFLKDFINYAIDKCDYIGAVNEGDAVAIASGARLGGKKSIVLMQNSGLTNAISPLVSLNYPFQIPILGFVSLRGEEGLGDEPQHELMGTITTNFLDLMKIKWAFLSDDMDEAMEQLNVANNLIERNESYFFLVKKGTLKSYVLSEKQVKVRGNLHLRRKVTDDQFPSRIDALTVINGLKSNKTLQIATTGKTGRELYEIENSVNNFYMVGSMGCVSPFGLGLSIVQPDKDVIVIDGDGSLLMRMGSLSTNGSYGPGNMLHILLDNETHDSTGGQKTVSSGVEFVQVASACGYGSSFYIHSLEELKIAINDWKKTKGLTFLHLKIAKGSKKNLGRPKERPFEIKDRLERFLGHR